MNHSDEQFTIKLDEIGKAYEAAKEAIYGLTYPTDVTTRNRDIDKAHENIRKLRDLAATALRAQFVIQEN